MSMSAPGRPTGGSLPIEDSFFEMLIDTLEGLDRAARGLFLQRLLKSLTQLDLTESQSLETWENILDRRRELTQVLGRPVALKTAMVDVLSTSNMVRAPILMEYEELKKLQVSAATDPLTGLYNRRLFEEYFEKELNRARRYDFSLALIVMDLHVFKQVNDRYGHPRGDEVLQLAATTLRNSMRTSDYAFRIGGDEFALLLPQADVEQAGILGRRIHVNFGAALSGGLIEIALGLDYGLAVYPQDGDQTETMLRVADERLYQMKYSKRTEPEGGLGASSSEGTSAPKEPTTRPSTRGTAPGATPMEVKPDTKAETKRESKSETKPEAKSEKLAAPMLEVPKPAQHSASPAGKHPTVERRRSERILLTGKRAVAVIGAAPNETLRVIDMSHGGVALEVMDQVPLPESFHAILRVPILGEVRVKLKKLYTHPLTEHQVRVGCLYVT
jgi:diguanylate cyclase (GGDEF)-like protein